MSPVWQMEKLKVKVGKQVVQCRTANQDSGLGRWILQLQCPTTRKQPPRSSVVRLCILQKSKHIHHYSGKGICMDSFQMQVLDVKE